MNVFRRTRREFLAGAAGAAIMCQATAKALPIPTQIKAFCADFNWYQGVFAPPGHWADASPEEHVRWYQALGCNTIQTFCVSCNGYAWFNNGFVPAQPGLKYDFLTDLVRLGHERGMIVTGYFCVGANSKWGQEHPDLSYGTPPAPHIPFTDTYLEYLSRSMEVAVRRTGLDGYMIDWVWNPSDKVRATGWIESEQELFTQLTGKTFPTSGTPSKQDQLAYERRAIDRCWEQIRNARNRANPNCILWLSCNNLTDPTVAGSRMLRECDWVMNEAPERKLLESARSMVGKNTRLIQDLVGWVQHDARSFLENPANRALDFYGFAEPRDRSLPPAVEEYLARPVGAFAGKGRFDVNDRNTAVLARFYRRMSLDSVLPH